MPRALSFNPLFCMICITSMLLIGCQSNTPTKNENAAQHNIDLGLAYFQQGNVERAKVKLNRALEQAPDLPSANYSMAYYFEQTGNAQEAEHYYEKAIHFNPRMGEANNNYAAFLCRRGEYDEADDLFLKAVKDPSYATPAAAYENAGLCAVDAGDNRKAKYYFQAALNIDPKRATSRLLLQQMQESLAS